MTGVSVATMTQNETTDPYKAFCKRMTCNTNSVALAVQTFGGLARTATGGGGKFDRVDEMADKIYVCIREIVADVKGYAAVDRAYDELHDTQKRAQAAFDKVLKVANVGDLLSPLNPALMELTESVVSVQSARYRLGEVAAEPQERAAAEAEMLAQLETRADLLPYCDPDVEYGVE